MVKTFEETAEVIDRNGTPTQAKKEGRGTNCISNHKDVRCFYKVVLNLPANFVICEKSRNACGPRRSILQKWQALGMSSSLHLLADCTADISLP